MKFTVLSGSPKGDGSVTLQYVRYLEKIYPEHDYTVHHVAQKIRALEKKDDAFDEVIDSVRNSDGIIWSFPLYYLLVHAGLKRFIELVNERGATDAFSQKYAAGISTSIHFFDHTAHAYIHGVSEDLGMRYVSSFSPHMIDLLGGEGRKKLRFFAENFFDAIERKATIPRRYGPITPVTLTYTPKAADEKIGTGGKRVVVVTDARPTDGNLNGMIRRFTGALAGDVDVLNLADVDITGDCRGCIQCGYDFTCAYEGKDGFIDFYRDRVMTADIVVFASTIRDRYLSADIKRMFDRTFFNTHTPRHSKKQVGFLVSGPLSQLPNLREIMEGFFQVEESNLVDMISDEYDDSETLNHVIDDFARNIIRAAAAEYVRPLDFLGVGGRKIFRDDMYAGLKFPFQADHRYYKKNGYYDFPHKNYKIRIMSGVLSALTVIPPIREEIYKRRIREEMVKPFIKVVEKADA
ncbi:MAG: NAD(P)H-dependent oxidoreductase [Deltaproteobacteria bacterium]|nr:NAD(P)H-dependent oxidoreductase [Candidatus Zymogenaceae bacterium]